MKKSNDRGFTILELLIATTIFSVVLLLAATALIQIGRTYYKGNERTRTQEVAREITDQISRDIQFAGGSVGASAMALDDMTGVPEAGLQNTAWGSPGFVNEKIRTFCVGKKRYFYLINRKLDPKFKPTLYATSEKFAWSLGLFTYNDPEFCPQARVTDFTKDLGGKIRQSKELLSPGMILSRLDVQETAPNSNAWRVHIRILNTDEEDFIDKGSTDPALPADNAAKDWRCKTDKHSSQFCAEAELSTVVHKRVN